MASKVICLPRYKYSLRVGDGRCNINISIKAAVNPVKEGRILHFIVSY